MEYVVIFEKGENNYGAYAPDLPGCGVVGETLEEVRTLIAEAIEFHIEGLQEAGEVVPQPSFVLPIQDQPGVSFESITVEKKERPEEIEEFFRTLEQNYGEYQKYFAALATLPPARKRPPVIVEYGNSTVSYGGSEDA